MRAALFGATRGIGRAVARELAGRGARLALLGRDPEALRSAARDLELRGAASPVVCVPCDLLEPSGFEPALEGAVQQLGGLDTVVVTAALFAPQEVLEHDLLAVERLLRADFVNTVLFCELAAQRLAAQGGGTLCAFGSVAGDRPRPSVALYGAAKAGLAYHLQGLDMRFRDRGVHVLLVKPGFVRTGMTKNLRPPPLAADPEPVARATVRALVRGRREIYAPGVWRAVMWGVRALPRRALLRLGI